MTMNVCGASPSKSDRKLNRFCKLAYVLAGVGVAAFPAPAAVAGSDPCPTRKVVPSGARRADSFGADLAMTADSLLIGAPATDMGTPTSGAVHVFRFDGNAWRPSQLLASGVQMPRGEFGARLAASGSRAAILSRQLNRKGHSVGNQTIHVFEYAEEVWTERSRIRPPDPEASTVFGEQIAMDGDVMAVLDAWAYADGTAFVFRRRGDTWVEEAHLLPPDRPYSNGVESVAVSGDVVAIGSPRGFPRYAGAVDVFRFDGQTWAHEAELYPGTDKVYAWFGAAVAVRGDMIWVGAPREFRELDEAGVVYVYQYDGRNWVLLGEVIAADEPSYFGQSISVTDHHVIIDAQIGTPYDPIEPRASVFYRLDLGPPDPADPPVRVAWSGEYARHTSFGHWLAMMRGGRDTREPSRPAAAARVVDLSECRPAPPGPPCWKDRLLSRDQNMTEFGYGVALQGDEAVVWARDGQLGLCDSDPAVYVYQRDPHGWIRRQILKLDTVSPGSRVVLDGNTFAIGGSHYGAVYIFENIGGQWALEEILEGSNDAFGGAIALQGETLWVGDIEDREGGGYRAGAMYIYTRGEQGWQQRQKLIAGDSGENARFGAGVAVRDERAVVGAEFANPDVGTGAVYAYEFNGEQWTEVQKLVPMDGRRGDYFGSALAMDESILVVGAQWDGRFGERVGVTYVFRRQGQEWIEEQMLKPPDEDVRGRFGASVAVTNGRVLVRQRGAIHVFEFDGEEWVSTRRLHPGAYTVPPDSYVISLAVEGDTVLLGAPVFHLYDGAVYEFDISDETCLETARVKTKCRSAGGEARLIVSITDAGPSRALRVELDGKFAAAAYTDCQGAARIRLRGVSPGEHVVRIGPCGWEREVECP